MTTTNITHRLQYRYARDMGEEILRLLGFDETEYPGLWERTEVVDLVAIHVTERLNACGITVITPDGDPLSGGEVRDAVRSAFA